MALAPFLAAALAPMVEKAAGRFAGWVLALVPAALFFLLLDLSQPVWSGGSLRAEFGWVPAYDIHLSFLLDGLSAIFALTIAGWAR